MADGYNLVDNMVQEIQTNNSPEILNYQPGMGPMQGGGGMMPPQHGGMGMMPQQVQIGEVQYIPPEQQQAMTMRNNMAANMAGEQMIAPSHGGGGEAEEAAMDAPDLSNYGMEEEGSAGMMDNLMNEGKGPLIVIALAFAMSLPQVNAILRNMLARVTTNPMYMNIAMALILGVAFWLVNKFL